MEQYQYQQHHHQQQQQQQQQHQQQQQQQQQHQHPQQQQQQQPPPVIHIPEQASQCSWGNDCCNWQLAAAAARAAAVARAAAAEAAAEAETPPALQTELPAMEQTSQESMTVAQWMANKRTVSNERSKKARRFYQAQNNMIDSFIQIMHGHKPRALRRRRGPSYDHEAYHSSLVAQGAETNNTTNNNSATTTTAGTATATKSGGSGGSGGNDGGDGNGNGNGIGNNVSPRPAVAAGNSAPRGGGWSHKRQLHLSSQDIINYDNDNDDDEAQLLPLNVFSETGSNHSLDGSGDDVERGLPRGDDGGNDGEEENEEEEEEEEEEERGVRVPGFPFFATPLHAARWSLVGNIVLLATVAVAMVISGSLAVLSSFVDLTLDLFGGVVVWYAQRKMRQVSVEKFPVGNQRYEQIAVLVIAAVMSTAACELILVAIQDLIHHNNADDISFLPLALLGATVVIKLVLFLFCRRIPSPSARALTVDHKNDIFSNSLTLIIVFLASKVWAPLDKIGAIIIAFLIIYNWVQEALEHINVLSGGVASPKLIQQLTFTAMVHSPLILKVDTVRAYQMGSDALAEVDIVLSPDLPLKVAHDVAESLQHRLEHVPGMARAFVHVDTEVDHSAADEHKPLH